MSRSTNLWVLRITFALLVIAFLLAWYFIQNPVQASVGEQVKTHALDNHVSVSETVATLQFDGQEVAQHFGFVDYDDLLDNERILGLLFTPCFDEIVLNFKDDNQLSDTTLNTLDGHFKKVLTTALPEIEPCGETHIGQPWLYPTFTIWNEVRAENQALFLRLETVILDRNKSLPEQYRDPLVHEKLFLLSEVKTNHEGIIEGITKMLRDFALEYHTHLGTNP